MHFREDIEKREMTLLHPLATKSRLTKGRMRTEAECDVRTVFQKDRDRIIHSKAFRRLKHKTQVFIAPDGDHFRTRLTHTLEVAQISRTIARALCLNEDLAEAIALGHDLGHPPFGHAGEEALNEVHPGGFEHNVQSLRVVNELEGGKGLNLTWEVRDGILNHRGDNLPSTLEGQIVRIADRVAYINHDIDDAIRGGIMQVQDLPKECLEILGESHSQRINTMVKDLVQNSWNQESICMSEKVQDVTDKLRAFMFANVYIGSVAKKEESKAKNALKQLYDFYLKDTKQLPLEYKIKLENETLHQVVCDYLAGMTDRFLVLMFEKHFVPQGFHSFQRI